MEHFQKESITFVKHHKCVKAAWKENSTDARDCARRVVTYLFQLVSLQILENL
jgi:hypothetical protein